MQTYITPDQIVIGTQFKAGGKFPKLYTVVDIYKTYNLAGQLVKTRYVATHEMLGQLVHDYDVCAVTIQRGHVTRDVL